MKPCVVNHDDGMSVSSKSRMKTLSSEKVTVAMDDIRVAKNTLNFIGMCESP